MLFDNSGNAASTRNKLLILIVYTILNTVQCNKRGPLTTGRQRRTNSKSTNCRNRKCWRRSQPIAETPIDDLSPV